jgi:hypothetical protein
VEVLQGVKDERNILQTTKTRKDNWTGHISHRNCLLNTLLLERQKDRSERKMRKKTSAANGQL